jgi:hypothetical protein
MLVLCNLLLVDTVLVCAQGTTTEPAEINGSIRGNNIPPIQVANWTKINLTITDQTGIPWGKMQNNSWLKFASKFIWPFIHPTWRRYLGYTSLTLETEIVEGNPRGWYTKITPTYIPQTDAGITYNNVTLYVKTDDIAVDYAVVVGVKVSRLDIYGKESGVSIIKIPVKASALNNLKMNTIGATTINVAPHSYASFDVNIQNHGYYKSMFYLTFANASDLFVSTPQQIIVLNPDETQAVKIDILTPETFYDLGTPHTISVYVTSISDPTPRLVGSLVVVTEGLYISSLVGIIAVPIIVILILLYLFVFYWREKREKERYGKPEKPWKLPEEQAHLRELKKNDKKAYDQERLMMEDEYKSALFFYQDYRQSLKRKPIEKIPEKKKKPKKPLFALFKKSGKPPKVEEKKVEAIVPAEDSSKQKALAKIQHEQDKALKKRK